MQFITYYLLFIPLFYCVAQQTTDAAIPIEFIRELKLEADQFIGVDDFENLYYIRNNTFYKKTTDRTYAYSNIQFGGFSSIDIKNPLKILLFYNNFNTAIILDNNLNELTSPFNFTSESISKNIAFATISSNDNLWLYSLDDNILRLWNYQSKKTILATQPMTFYVNNFRAAQMVSSYRNCWLFGDNSLIKINEYGTFIGKFEIETIDEVKSYGNNIIFSKNNNLNMSIDSSEFLPIKMDRKLFIKSFYFNKNHIYIFDGLKILVFKIIKN